MLGAEWEQQKFSTRTTAMPVIPGVRTRGVFRQWSNRERRYRKADGKVAVVTEAFKGVGASITEDLAVQGASVVVKCGTYEFGRSTKERLRIFEKPSTLTG